MHSFLSYSLLEELLSPRSSTVGKSNGFKGSAVSRSPIGESATLAPPGSSDKSRFSLMAARSLLHFGPLRLFLGIPIISKLNHASSTIIAYARLD